VIYTFGLNWARTAFPIGVALYEDFGLGGPMPDPTRSQGKIAARTLNRTKICGIDKLS
jgi:hypothetical protein